MLGKAANADKYDRRYATAPLPVGQTEKLRRQLLPAARRSTELPACQSDFRGNYQTVHNTKF